MIELKWDGSPHFDSNLKDIAFSLKFKNQDWFHLGAGDNGSGKSTLGIYGCFKVDPTFNIDRIIFSLTQLKRAIKNLEPTQAIMLDELGDIMYSRDWNRAESKELAKYWMIMRYKRNFIWMNIPKIEYADIYVRQGRLSSMTKTYTVERKTRDENGEWRKWRELGFFSGYTKKAVINHFEKHYYLKPAFSEKYPEMKKLGDEARHLVELYEAKKETYGSFRTDEITKEENEDEPKRSRGDRLRLKDVIAG